MTIAESIIAELRQEAIATRKLLERVPDEHLDWKPHDKSMSLRELASHIAESFTWIESMLEQDVLTMDPEKYKPWMGNDRAEIVATFDKNVEATARALEGYPDERMHATWTMKAGDKTVFSAPRIGVVRTFALGHHIHHRGQLDVYLRLKDVPLPQIYGPTADEPNFG